jgi:hypothetical protein
MPDQPKLGTEKLRRFDDDGCERRERLDAIALCPKCGADVLCWADTEEWTEGDDGRWHHSGYGGAMGVCEKCNLLIADCLADGFQVFDLRRVAKEDDDTPDPLDGDDERVARGSTDPDGPQF